MTLAEAPDVKRNLLDHPSLEPVQKPAKEFYSDKDLKAREWRKLNPHLPDWYTSHVEGDVSKYSWDAGEAHSGQHSLAIGKNLYAYLGHWITSFPVQPGCRYRLAWWVKQNPMPSGSGPRFGSVTVSEGVAQEYRGEYPRARNPSRGRANCCSPRRPARCAALPRSAPRGKRTGSLPGSTTSRWSRSMTRPISRSRRNAMRRWTTVQYRVGESCLAAFLGNSSQ